METKLRAPVARASEAFPAALPPSVSDEKIWFELLRALPEGITLQEPNGRLVFANATGARILGFRSPDELIQAPVGEVTARFELFDEQGEPLPVDSLPSRLALTGVEAPERLIRFRVRQSGEERWSVTRSTPIFDAGGRVARVITFFRDVTDQKRAELRERFLAQASARFSVNVPRFEEVIQSVATSAVPDIADWCGVELLEETGALRQVAMAHRDPGKVALAREYRQKYPPDMQAATGLARVLRTGKSELVPEIPARLIDEAPVPEAQKALLRSLQIHSYIAAPLIARGRTLGAITFVYAESGRRFSPEDLPLVEALADRAAMAIDNAMLLRESRRWAERMDVATEAGRLGAWEWDIAGGKVTWSPALERIHGLPVGSFDGTFEMYQSDIHPDDKERVLRHLQALLRERRRDHHISYRIIRPDGQVRWLEASGQLLSNAQGEPQRLLGVCTDVTDRLLAEDNARALAAEQAARAEAERARARTQRILESITDPFFVIGEDGAVAYANGPARSLLKGLEPLRAQLEAARHAGEALAVEAKDELLERWFQVNAYPAAGQLSVYCRDITQQKMAERALAAHAEELSRSNSELQQFAYVASHDLQEPLRMVASYTQLLARRYQGKLDADADQFIQYAVEGVRRMQELINDLLSYSRVGTLGRALVALPLSQAAEQALRNVRSALDESGARVEIDGLPNVRGDASQLTQLFQNLFANAVKFRGDEAPHIRVTAQVEGDSVRVTVRDNGIGIAPEYSERVFVIFQRLHTRQEYPGNGIGLAICKKIIERHGGRIWVESQPGEGAAFHFTLSAAQEVQA